MVGHNQEAKIECPRLLKLPKKLWKNWPSNLHLQPGGPDNARVQWPLRQTCLVWLCLCSITNKWLFLYSVTLRLSCFFALIVCLFMGHIHLIRAVCWELVKTTAYWRTPLDWLRIWKAPDETNSTGSFSLPAAVNVQQLLVISTAAYYFLTSIFAHHHYCMTANKQFFLCAKCILHSAHIRIQPLIFSLGCCRINMQECYFLLRRVFTQIKSLTVWLKSFWKKKCSLKWKLENKWKISCSRHVKTQ